MSSKGIRPSATPQWIGAPPRDSTRVMLVLMIAPVLSGVFLAQAIIGAVLEHWRAIPCAVLFVAFTVPWILTMRAKQRAVREWVDAEKARMRALSGLTIARSPEAK